MGQKSVLLVCAVMSYQKSMEDALKLNGFKVTSTSEGFHALSLMDSEKYALVVIGPDVRVMGCSEVLSLIRSKYVKTTLPIIRVLSAEDSNELKQADSEEAIKLGANDIFVGMEPRKFIEKIHHTLLQPKKSN